jgi:hypothetical protein
MATVSRPNGFKPVKSLSASSYTGQTNSYFVPASDASVIMVGDLVSLVAGSRSPTGVPTVTRAGATGAVVGVVLGISFEGQGDTMNMPPVNDLNTPIYRRASTDRYLLVADDPTITFEVQVSSSAGFAATAVGKNASPTVTAGNTASGASGMQLDTTTLATTATLPLKVVGYPYRPDNNLGDAFFSAYVKINNHAYGSGTGTVGV